MNNKTYLREKNTYVAFHPCSTPIVSSFHTPELLGTRTFRVHYWHSCCIDACDTQMAKNSSSPLWCDNGIFLNETENVIEIFYRRVKCLYKRFLSSIERLSSFKTKTTSVKRLYVQACLISLSGKYKRVNSRLTKCSFF